MFVVAAVAMYAEKAVVNPESMIENTQEGAEARILKLCRWYIDNPTYQDSELRQKVAAEILVYAINTKDFSLTLGEPVTGLLELSPGHSGMEDLLMVYFAGETIYCLEHNLKKNNAASYAYSMECVMNYYAQKPEHPIASLNKYLNMDPMKRMEVFEALYNK